MFVPMLKTQSWAERSQTVNNKLLAKSQGWGQTSLGAEPHYTVLDCAPANLIKSIIFAPGVFNYPSALNAKMLRCVPHLWVVFPLLSVSKLQDKRVVHWLLNYLTIPLASPPLLQEDFVCSTLPWLTAAAWCAMRNWEENLIYLWNRKIIRVTNYQHVCFLHYSLLSSRNSSFFFLSHLFLMLVATAQLKMSAKNRDEHS